MAGARELAALADQPARPGARSRRARRRRPGTLALRACARRARRSRHDDVGAARGPLGRPMSEAFTVADPFVMPEDVVLTSVSALPPALRRELECEDGDYAVTRPHSRTPSRVIDAST